MTAFVEAAAGNVDVAVVGECELGVRDVGESELGTCEEDDCGRRGVSESEGWRYDSAIRSLASLQVLVERPQ